MQEREREARGGGAPPGRWRAVPWATLAFGTLLGYFEAACVAYLKRLEALGQLAVPRDVFDNRLLLIELGREAVSLGLLALWAWTAGRGRAERAGHLAVAFGVWDIAYYVFLRWTIGWPQSLLDWDVLFLIPAPWYGPVIAPVLVSLLLVGGGLAVVTGELAGRRLIVRAPDLVLVGAGAAAVLAAFLWNAAVLVPFPSSFPWALFAPGWLAVAFGLARMAVGRRPG